MPYKARLKQGEVRKRKKTEYWVTNACAYNVSLKRCGVISPYFPDGNLKGLCRDKAEERIIVRIMRITYAASE
jgi:hypothetical protein